MPAKPNSSSEQIVDIDPLVIYFTFSRIRPRFSCGRTIESTIQQFRDGELQPRDLPLLSVLTDGTHYFSQNNRRLYTYKQLKRDGLLEVVPVRLRPFPQTKRMQHKYTPATCSLTATLMRDVERSSGATPATATAKTSTDVERQSDADADEGSRSSSVSDKKGKVEGAVEEQGQSSSTDAGRLHTMPAASSLRPLAPKQKSGERAVEHDDNVRDGEEGDASSPLSRQQQKSVQKAQKKTRQQQQKKKGRRGNGKESDSDSEAGGVNSLEAELRNLGLQ